MAKALLLIASALGLLVTATVGWFFAYNALWNGNLGDGRKAFVCFALFNGFSVLNKIVAWEKK